MGCDSSPSPVLWLAAVASGTEESAVRSESEFVHVEFLRTVVNVCEFEKCHCFLRSYVGAQNRTELLKYSEGFTSVQRETIELL